VADCSRKIAIIGDGGWGTALSLSLLRGGHEVTVWGPFPEYIAQIERERENKTYLPGVALPAELRWTADRAAATEGAEFVVLAVPTQYFREVVASFAAHVPAEARVVSVAKGLDADTYKRMSEVASELLGGRPVAALSGPSHAEEVARGVPTAVVLACAESEPARELQAVFMNPRFRVYTSDDIAGVELGAALKNVIAIAVGVSDGMGFGDNTRAALITRGLAEMTRLGVALGARAATFAGLSGMGDLIVTCTSRHSRNRGVGERIGRGESIERILGGMKQVAEGVRNAELAKALGDRHGVALPITEQVHAILRAGRDPSEAVHALLTRRGRGE